MRYGVPFPRRKRYFRLIVTTGEKTVCYVKNRGSGIITRDVIRRLCQGSKLIRTLHTRLSILLTHLCSFLTGLCVSPDFGRSFAYLIQNNIQNQKP